MLGILTGMPSVVMAKSGIDSLILSKVFTYRKNYVQEDSTLETNVYMRAYYVTVKRNFTLFLVPHMLAIARGNRDYICEIYGKMSYDGGENINTNAQVIAGTISSNRRIMPTVLKLMTPTLYDIALFKNKTLSPFHASNRFYYKYSMTFIGDDLVKLYFKPKRKNAQLVWGHAIVDFNTGRILSSDIAGEYEMVHYHTTTTHEEDPLHSLLPKKTNTDITFKFLGNRIHVALDAEYNCPINLPDSIKNVTDRKLMDELRPYPLSNVEQSTYQAYDKLHTPTNDATQDSINQKTIKKQNRIWNIIDRSLFRSVRASNEKMKIRLAPLINPQYLTYMNNRGVSYKISLGAQYNFSQHRFITTNPQLGYNFKFKNLFLRVPLRIVYNPNRHGYAEVIWTTGERLAHATMLQNLEEMQARGELPRELKLADRDLDFFKNTQLKVTNNIGLVKGLQLETGFVYYTRTALNEKFLKELGMPTKFRAFAPIVTLKIRPWEKGPQFTIDYERAFKGIMGSTSEYERWEIDAAVTYRLKRLRLLNLRVGTGFYTMRKSNFFVDYVNFRDTNIPEGWNDKWTGNFQTLNSRWYNSSDYYLRANISYDSPLLMLSFAPYVGKYIERERLYLGMLSIQDLGFFTEVGYGFTCRIVSIGLFTSFQNFKPKRFGFKFSFELFRHW